MIKIVTWLLTVSTGIVSLYATNKLAVGTTRGLLLFVGILVSVLAAFTALLYGGYAAWNWAIADRIAEANDWIEQSPSFKPIPEKAIRWWDRIPLCLAGPCADSIAPIFWVFFVASVASLLVHAILLYQCGAACG